MSIKIQLYDDKLHRRKVIDVFKTCFNYNNARNNPELSIDNKISVKDNLFFVAVENGLVIGTVMGGYDGHRGWIYSLAVLPEKRGFGVGGHLLSHAENEIAKRGCVKINLQVVKGNEHLIDYYAKRGFTVEERISMGKEISENI